MLLVSNSRTSRLVMRKPDRVKKVETPRNPPLAQREPAVEQQHADDGEAAQAVEAGQVRHPLAPQTDL